MEHAAHVSAPDGAPTLSQIAARDDEDELKPGKAHVRRLLLATDLSSVSDLATDRAIELAVRHRAEIIVLSVLDPGRLRLPGGRFLRRIDQERSRLEAGAQLLVGRVRAAGAQATFLVWEGEPAEEGARCRVLIVGAKTSAA
jgi:hypothetical protein